MGMRGKTSGKTIWTRGLFRYKLQSCELSLQAGYMASGPPTVCQHQIFYCCRNNRDKRCVLHERKNLQANNSRTNFYCTCRRRLSTLSKTVWLQDISWLHWWVVWHGNWSHKKSWKNSFQLPGPLMSRPYRTIQAGRTYYQTQSPAILWPATSTKLKYWYYKQSGRTF